MFCWNKIFVLIFCHFHGLKLASSSLCNVGWIWIGWFSTLSHRKKYNTNISPMHLQMFLGRRPWTLQIVFRPVDRRRMLEDAFRISICVWKQFQIAHRLVISMWMVWTFIHMAWSTVYRLLYSPFLIKGRHLSS